MSGLSSRRALAPLERERIETNISLMDVATGEVLSLRWSERGLKPCPVAVGTRVPPVLSLRWSERGLKHRFRRPPLSSMVSALAPLERERIETYYSLDMAPSCTVLSLRWSERGLKLRRAGGGG